MSDSNRFATLDALRGVAALGIMLFHTMPNSPLPIPGGYLAVDLFFAMSGFVIALSYEDKLRAGMGLRRFLTLRAIRLWPMLALGAVLGIVLHGGHSGMLFLLPNPFTSGLYPTNPPYWSLLLEVVAYLGFAVLAPRLRLSGLLVLAAVSGTALAAFTLWSGGLFFEFGGFWSTLPAGLARVAFSFSIGVLVYRLRKGTGQQPVEDIRAWLVLAGLAAIMFMMPVSDQAGGQLGGLASVLFAVPLLLWFATKWELPARRLAAQLGALSYPLYCIHMPILAIGALQGPGLPFVWLLLMAASWLLDRYRDRPMRRWLANAFAASARQTRIGIST